jgi:putative tricarboxylic transport membrane protein
MDLLQNLALGFEASLTPLNLGFVLIGCLLGTLIGVLPGIGPIATIAILLPATFSLPPITALIMLAGIYYGAQYGGSTTAILVNLPGESSSVMTCIDGHQMAKNGRAGSALAIAAIGSFFAGTVTTVLIAGFAPALGEFADRFRPQEYFALMVLGLIGAVMLANGSVINAIGMVLLGLLFGLVGTDLTSGTVRFAFNVPELRDGIDFVPLAVGVFGLAEILTNLDKSAGERQLLQSQISNIWPNREEFRRATPAILRGTGLGALLGLLPGGGAVFAAFAAYALEKKVARDPSRFGHGAIEGVAGPESANNAGAQSSFVPLLTLGIPSTPIMALMMAAMVIQGIAPGTAVIKDQPVLFWAIIASMWTANLMLLIINLPLIGIWVRLLRIPYRLLFPTIVLFCCVGAYSISNSPVAVITTAVFAALGYAFAKLGCEGAPFILSFILGPLLEENLRRSLIFSDGNPVTFIERPISASLLAAAVGLIVLLVLPKLRNANTETMRG